jgi:hypothetical protein
MFFAAPGYSLEMQRRWKIWLGTSSVPPFLRKRMAYIPDESKVVYRSKDDKKDKTFDALEWLAAMCSHVPNRGEQMVRYYGYYSNLCRGKREKQNKDDLIPCVLEPSGSSKEYRKNWARLIQKIYEVDPLTCPKCSGEMKVISIIEDEEVIKKILKHLGLPSCLKPQVEFAYDCGIGE